MSFPAARATADYRSRVADLPGPKSGRPLSENTVNNALRLLGSSGDDMTDHGFRTVASTFNEQGWHEDLIELQLAPDDRDESRPVGIVLIVPFIVVIVPTMRSTDLIKELEKAGWTLRSVRGSHHVFQHLNRPGHLTVPHPKKDLGKGLVHKILKQAGLK